MPPVVTSLEESVLEISNPSGSKAVVVVCFEMGGKIGQHQVAAGGTQRFSKFGRLTVEAPEGGGVVRLFNPSPLSVDAYVETKSERLLAATLKSNDRFDRSLEPGEQLFLLPRVELYVPPEPRIVQAVYKTNNILTAKDNVVEISWTYPREDLPKTMGFNHYQAFYHGNHPISIHRLNDYPKLENFFGIYDFVKAPHENHRYAVTAVSHAGVESLFSNVVVLDKSVMFKLIDAGYIPL
jgi:hypothetical protein